MYRTTTMSASPPPSMHHSRNSIRELAGYQRRPALRGEPDGSTARRRQRATRLQIREHVFPRTRGLRVFIEGLQPFPDDALDLRRHGRAAIVRLGGAGPDRPNRSGLAHGTRLRLYHAVRNGTPCDLLRLPWLSAVPTINAAFNMGHRRHFLSFRFRDVRLLA